MRQDFLPFHVPDIREAEIKAVEAVLRSPWITTGPRTKDFEESFRAYVGASHAVAVNSCTAALHLALEAAGVGPADEVLVPAMTFAATAEVLAYVRAKPVLVDCEPDTLNMDVQDLERKITRKTKAVIPVHYGGRPCRMDRILEVSRARGIRVIEDAAHALPAAFGGRRIGALGDATCFSFYATKTLTTGEGGMITTEDPAWAERMRIMSLHGISKDAWKRYAAEGSWRYEILRPGFKYNLTDIASALGLEQLKRCDDMAAARAGIAGAYDRAFGGVEELETPPPSAPGENAWHLYVLRLNLRTLKIDRDLFVQKMKEMNIGTSVHFIPLHLHPYYRKTLDLRPQDLPQASAAFERIVSLPLFPTMTARDTADVVEAVKALVSQHRR